MAMIEQTYNLDLVPNGQPLVVNVSQYDVNSRTLTFNLFNGGVAYAPETGTAAYIMGSKPDQTGFIYAMTVSGNSASVEIYQQMTAVAGDIPCEVRLVDTSGAVIGSANFVLSVEKAALDEDAVISESDIPVFENLAAQAAASAAEASASATQAAALFPSGGTAGQVLTKTTSGTEWADQTGGGGTENLKVTITYANSTYSADHTYAEIMANIEAGGMPCAQYGDRVLELIQYSSTFIRFGYVPTSSGMNYYSINSDGTVNYYANNIGTTVRYYLTTLGSATATSDSTVYSGGYKLTLTNSTVAQLSKADVFFPNGDYSGNVTWETTPGEIEVYFDQNPNGKTIWISWETMVYTACTIS